MHKQYRRYWSHRTWSRINGTMQVLLLYGIVKFPKIFRGLTKRSLVCRPISV